MSEIEFIRTTLARLARRQRWQRAWKGFGRGLLFGAALWLAVLGAYKVFPLPPVSLAIAAIAGGVCALAGLIAGAWRPVRLPETARWLDAQQQLKERLSTALELSSANAAAEWKALLLRDAAEHARAVDARRLLPFQFPQVMRWALVLVAVGVGLGFVPEYRSVRQQQRAKEAANIREIGQQLAALTRQQLTEHKPVLEPVQEAVAAVAEKGDVLSKATLNREQALNELANVAEKLAQESAQLAQNPALRRMERAARQGVDPSASPQDLQRRMEALQQQLGKAGANAKGIEQLQRDLEKVRQRAEQMPAKGSPDGDAARDQMLQSLADLAQRADQMGASVPGLQEAIEALKADQTDLFLKDLNSALQDLDKLKQMAQAMQQLQQQAARVGKDLAEQLEKGQARSAQSTLEKMMEQLKSGGLPQEQLQKMIDELSKAAEPGSEYGKVGEHLQKAAGQLKQGQRGEASKELAQAAKELEQMMQQMADSEALQDALEALQRAQWAVANNKNWEQAGQCEGCNGNGCGACKSRRWGKGGRPGSGVGTWADETGWTAWEQGGEPVDNSGIERPDMDPRGHTERSDDLNPNLKQTKLRGSMGPGGSMPSVTLKGLSIAGQSKVSLEEATATAQREAQSALNQDQVPRAYRSAVRDYFDDAKK